MKEQKKKKKDSSRFSSKLIFRSIKRGNEEKRTKETNEQTNK